MRRQLIRKEPVSGRASHKDYAGKEKKKNASEPNYTVTIDCLNGTYKSIIFPLHTFCPGTGN